MRSLRAVALLGTVLVLALVATPGASAATEVGDECAANEAAAQFTLVPEAHVPSGPLPLAAPSAGVVTAWKVKSEYPDPVPEVMAAFRPAGTGKFQVVGESNEESAGPGLNVFPTRIPVQAGDRLGLTPVGTGSPPHLRNR